tara:strand:- start:2982 stop:3212 length:231 start_codon:yes stop_codon:yes gene_type:complete
MVNFFLCYGNYINFNFNNKNIKIMKNFGKLLKYIFLPKEKAFWIRVKKEFSSQKEKENFIFATIELLSNEIKVNEI